MTRRHVVSIPRNAAPSTGICFMISSDPKMGSRYSPLSGAHIVHYPAQLEPCLTHKSTLLTLNTP